MAAAPSPAQEEWPRPLRLSGVEQQAAYAIDLASGEVVYDYHGSERLTPASVTKVLTTAAALAYKAPDFRIRTRIGYVADSALLVVHGAFDPTTDSRFFNKHQLAHTCDTLARQLKKMGAEHIKALVFDLSKGMFAPYCSKRTWEDMGNYYGAAPTALMCDDNAVNVYFTSPKTLDKPTRIDSIAPDMGGRSILNHVRSYKGSADLCNIYLAGDLWYATGCIPAGKRAFAVRGAMPDPEQHYMDKLTAMLRRRGVTIDRTRVERGRADRADTAIISVWSPQLKDIVKTTNLFSVNLFADALPMALSPGQAHMTWSGAAAWVRSFWSKRLAFTPCIYDGSGLSPFGAISPAELASVLAFMARSPVSFEWKNSLPVMGQTGTLRTLGRGTPLAGKVRAKSGTLSGVVSYAGYIPTTDGRELAFAIIVNHQAEDANTVRRAMVDWMLALSQQAIEPRSIVPEPPDLKELMPLGLSK